MMRRGVSVAMLVVLCLGLCAACALPIVAADAMHSVRGTRGLVADVCVGVRRVQRPQVAVGWISAQASTTIARPSPYYWAPGSSVCTYLPWTPLLREQGGIVFPG